MNCREYEDFFSEYLDGEMSHEKRVEFESHLDGCIVCRAAFNNFDTAMASLRALSATAAVPGNFADEVLDGLNVSQSLQMQASNNGVLYRFRFAFAAAASVILFVGGWFAGRGSVEESPVGVRMSEAGFTSVDGDWLSASSAAAVRDGLAYYDGQWMPASELTKRKNEEYGLVESGGRWLTVADTENIAKGRLFNGKSWVGADDVFQEQVAVKKLEEKYGSLLTPELKDRLDTEVENLKSGMLLSSAGWVKENDYRSDVLENADVVRREDGSMVFKQELERERLGFVRYDDHWVRPYDIFVKWMSDSGYSKGTDGRWLDMSKSEGSVDRPKPAELPAAGGGWREAAVPGDVLGWRPNPGLGVPVFFRNRVLSRLRLAAREVERKHITSVKNIGGYKISISGVTGQALGTPLVVGHNVIVGGGLNSRLVYAFNTEKGSLKWSAKLADRGPGNAVVSGQNVVFVTNNGSIYSMNAQRGRQRWSLDIASSGKFKSSPVSDGKNVYVAFNSGDAWRLGKFRESGGVLEWSRQLPGDVLVAPVISGENVYVTTRAGTLHCFNQDKGNQLWVKDVKAISRPTVTNEGIAFSRVVELKNAGEEQGFSRNEKYAEVVCLVGVKTAEFIKSEFGSPRRLKITTLKSLLPDLAHIVNDTANAEDGAIDRQPRPGAPVVGEGRLFLCRGDKLIAYDLRCGKESWKVQLGERYNPLLKDHDSLMTHSDPLVIAGKVIVGTLGGHVICIDSSSGKTLWEENIGSPIGNYASPMFTMNRVKPVVSRGRVFVTTLNGELVCIDTGKRELGE